MMTGTPEIFMWLMMGLMIAAMAGGAITWAERRLRQRTAQQPQPQAPGGQRAPPLDPSAVTRQPPGPRLQGSEPGARIPAPAPPGAHQPTAGVGAVPLTMSVKGSSQG
jgi:hypothetical protein